MWEHTDVNWQMWTSLTTYLVVKPCLSHRIRLSPPVPSMWPRCKRLPPVGLAVHQRSVDNNTSYQHVQHAVLLVWNVPPCLFIRTLPDWLTYLQSAQAPPRAPAWRLTRGRRACPWWMRPQTRQLRSGWCSSARWRWHQPPASARGGGGGRSLSPTERWKVAERRQTDVRSGVLNLWAAPWNLCKKVRASHLTLHSTIWFLFSYHSHEAVRRSHVQKSPWWHRHTQALISELLLYAGITPFLYWQKEW